RSLVTDPHPVDTHLVNLGHSVLAQGPDAGENENGERLSTLQNTFAKLHRAAAVKQKILVHDHYGELGIDLEIAFDHLVDVGPGRKQADVLALVEVRGAAEIAPVRTSQTAEHDPGARNLLREHL